MTAYKNSELKFEGFQCRIIENKQLENKRGSEQIQAASHYGDLGQ